MSQPPTRRRSVRLQGFDQEDTRENVKRSRTDAGPVAGKQVNGRSTTTNAGAGSKRKGSKVAYDEEDDGFMFTRTRSRTKAAVPAEETIREEREEPAVPVEKKRRRPNPSTGAAPDRDKEREPVGAKKKPRRSTRHSGDKDHLEQPKPRKPRHVENGTSEATRTDEDAVDLVGGGGESRMIEASNETKIALPFADTPIIKRNKELRKVGSQGRRRSSVGLRGRRASSLIDSGKSNALPHSEVEITEFYKHIEADGLPEPRRMKQLLTWCATRAMGEKPSYTSGDGNARMAARVIQEEILKDFSSRSEMSDWFSREDTHPAPLVTKKPNPRNVANAAKIEELEKEVKRLRDERKEWEALTTDPPDPPLEPLHLPLISASSTAGPSSPSSPTAKPPNIEIDEALLSPEQRAILTSLSSHAHAPSSSTTASTARPSSSSSHPPLASTAAATATANIQPRLSSLAQSLEPTIDTLAASLHTLSQYRHVADRLASRVLEDVAAKLEERDEELKAEAGTKEMGEGEVLRALGRLGGSGLGSGG
ncbi:MAG: hypothetical protein M1819_005673 [Sarea resinae]|nr:MAG: hypothetical protein M1819_005673 [Sarea resinae]